MNRTRVLVVDDQDFVARALSAVVEKGGHEAVTCHSVEAALEIFAREPFDVVLSDVKMGTLGGFDLLKGILERSAIVPVVLITGEATVHMAMDAVHAGAFAYLAKPVQLAALTETLQRAVAHKLNREASLRRPGGPVTPKDWPTIVGHSPGMIEAFMTVARASKGDSSVLILGENGTGKELVARALHETSARAARPFITVNTATIPENLAESELFGHVRGAFTDARETRQGLFEQANGGTLFLDEIGELNPVLQAKFLRAIQERRIKPVGGNDEIEVDIRLLCATNRDLLGMVRDHRFREDLYYRIRVITIQMPPLRERPEDIHDLVAFFLSLAATRAGRPAPTVTPEALDRLKRHPWPGNVRELQNTVQGAFELSRDDILTAEDFRLGSPQPGAGAAARQRASVAGAQYPTLRDRMDSYALEVLDHTGNNITQAARILDISRRTLQRMVGRLRKLESDDAELTHSGQF